MTCYGHWELDLDLGDGDVVELCARYAGHGTEVLRECEWCCWNKNIDDALEYKQACEHRDIMAEGVEWK
jgi:hypothetical protein